MGFPDRIERSISIAHPRRRWEAITTAEGLGTWFGHKATVDLRIGGLAHLTFDGGHSADLRIERLEPPYVLGYTWGISGLPADDPRRRVRYRLRSAPSGSRSSFSPRWPVTGTRAPTPSDGTSVREGQKPPRSVTTGLSAVRGRSVFVRTVYGNRRQRPVDTDMTRRFDIPNKADEDIFPDPMSESMAESWRNGAGNALQREDAPFVQTGPVSS
jgi:uncharacterized protein YndB with AHSA1/START domain